VVDGEHQRCAHRKSLPDTCLPRFSIPAFHHRVLAFSSAAFIGMLKGENLGKQLVKLF
jgi:hypothetical protein